MSGCLLEWVRITQTADFWNRNLSMHIITHQQDHDRILHRIGTGLFKTKAIGSLP